MDGVKHYLGKSKLFNPNRFEVYLLLGFVLSFIQFLSYYISNPPSEGYLTLIKGDVIDYIGLSENFIEYGVYGTENEPSIYRMPGFALFYLPFRLFLSKQMAINALVIFQFIFSIIAKYFFSKIIYAKTNSRALFLLCFTLLCFAPPLIFFNNILYTESLASSCLMFLFYILYLYHCKNENRYLFLSGLFLTLSIFLRPFLGVFIPLLILLILIKNKKKIDLNFLKLSFIFLSTFLVFESFWIGRNYIVFNRFIPLETSIQGTYCESSYCEWRKLVVHTGESNVFWDNNTVGTWFAPYEFLLKNSFKRPSDEILPEFLFTKYLTIDTLRKARDLSNGEFDKNIYSQETAELEAQRIFRMFDDSLRINHQITYHFYSRTTPFWDTFYQKTIPTKSLRYPLNVLTVGFNTFLSIFLLFLGLFSLFFVLVVEKDFFFRILSLCCFVLILVLDIILLDHENRFIVLVFPVLVLAALLTYKRIKKAYIFIVPFVVFAATIVFLEVLSMY
jgi:hypothetical protein